MTPDALYQRMAEAVSSPNYPLLKYYRTDFEVIDRQFIDRAWSDESKMLWIVGESGTHLIPLGIHPGMCDWGRAALTIAKDYDLFIADQAGLKKIDRAQALLALGSYSWQDHSGRICKGGRPLADILDIAIERSGRGLRADVKLASLVKPELLTLGETVGLVQMVERAAIDKAGTLFCATNSILIDGADIYRLMDAKREKWLGVHASETSLTKEPAPKTGRSLS